MYLYNAKIYTMDHNKPIVSALAMRDGKIMTVGDDQKILGEFCGLMSGQDMKGKTILPGLADAHIHLEYFALGLQKVDCETDSKAECLRRIAERVSETSVGDWVLGHGWNQNTWVEGFGTAAELDVTAPDNPVFLTAKSLHAAWVNTAALRKANLSDETPDPPGGALGKDGAGHLNGLLFESAVELVEKVAPEPTPKNLADAILEAQKTLWRMGITSVHDFDRRRCFLALQLLREQGRLRTRVLKSIPLDDLPHAVNLGLRTGFGDDWLKIGSVKVFADGALGPQTAAMLQPFDGSDDNRGMLLIDAEELVEKGRLAVGNGFSLAVHAIGDLANHEVLQAFGQLRQFELDQSRNGYPKLRHRIEHVQLIHPADAGRLAELEVIASMQPIHATSDMLIADRYWGQRSRYAYAWQTQLRNGAMLAFGSDAPVESANPFWGLHAAVTRQRIDQSPGPEGWFPEQKLSLQQALQAYTLGPAYAAGWEDRLGKLMPGYYGDLIVLEQDPFECPPQELYWLEPVATMTGGEWVYKK
jgi:predicted amidohydrolase YtcJ